MTFAVLLRHLCLTALLVLLSAATVRMMIAARVMDTPAARKAHDRPIPKGGGVGIVVTFLVGIAVLYRFAAFARNAASK
jgi:UDP-GlcNAc:undecaprenyl-phosphate/decaprenyl-phosphate GlcNAc-1-phosphate transferase